MRRLLLVLAVVLPIGVLSALWAFAGNWGTINQLAPTDADAVSAGAAEIRSFKLDFLTGAAIEHTNVNGFHAFKVFTNATRPSAANSLGRIFWNSNTRQWEMVQSVAMVNTWVPTTPRWDIAIDNVSLVGAGITTDIVIATRTGTEAPRFYETAVWTEYGTVDVYNDYAAGVTATAISWYIWHDVGAASTVDKLRITNSSGGATNVHYRVIDKGAQDP